MKPHISCYIIGLASLCAGTAHATLTFSATVGGAPTGVNYVNFDGLPLGNAGGNSNGLLVTLSGANVVTGSGFQYAAPYISNGNGQPFGDPTPNGQDTTRYISSFFSGSVSLQLPGNELYFGILWGSVDPSNSLTFFDSSNLSVGTITGLNVTASANGNQGAQGTFYVNVNSTLPFTRILISGGGTSFEFDNVAYNPTTPVPENSTAGLICLGITLLSGWRKLRREKGFSTARVAA